MEAPGHVPGVPSPKPGTDNCLGELGLCINHRSKGLLS